MPASVKLIAITEYLCNEGGTPEALIEHAARVCYRSHASGSRAVFISARLRDGHESVVEHASATFEISGISRACSHQLVRHRLASYSQESQRYVNMSAPEFVMPPSIERNTAARDIWDDFMRRAAEAYVALIQCGVSKEDARFVLPNATTTRIVVTMNFRELRHFFRVRLHPAAQWEIREVARKMLALVYQYAPTVFAEFMEVGNDTE